MNSINWPALSVWVFIAQTVEHCSANAEATGSNPVEAPKLFVGLLRNCLNCNSTAMVTYSFLCIPAVHIVSSCVSFLSRVQELNKLACPQCMGLHGSGSRAKEGAKILCFSRCQPIKVHRSTYIWKETNSNSEKLQI